MTPKMTASTYTMVSIVIASLFSSRITGIQIHIKNENASKEKPKGISKQDWIVYDDHKCSFWNNTARRRERKLAPKLSTVSNKLFPPVVVGTTIGAIIPPANHATANWVKNSV